MLLELCAYTVRSCRIAQAAGAGRVELCADPAQGGTTPSIGMVEAVLGMGVPVFPMIRPRGGDFIYDDDERAVMWRDIRACRERGCPGIVAGAQRRDGSLDAELMKRIVERAGPMAVTCHKVFDGVPDAAAALETLVEAGCARVLTSGLAATAMDGASVLRRLATQAAGRITVMPGGGVRSSNIAALASATGATEFHSSAITAASRNFTADAGELAALARALGALPR